MKDEDIRANYERLMTAITTNPHKPLARPSWRQAEIGVLQTYAPQHLRQLLKDIVARAKAESGGKTQEERRRNAAPWNRRLKDIVKLIGAEGGRAARDAQQLKDHASALNAEADFVWLKAIKPDKPLRPRGGAE